MTTTPLRPSTTWARARHTCPPASRPTCRPGSPASSSAPPYAGSRSRSAKAATSTKTWGTGGPEMRIQRPEEFFARLGRDGLIGFGEAYLTGAWDAEDLGGFLTVLAADLPTLVPAPLQKLRAAYVRRPPQRTSGTRTDNTRDNIAHHYDLSNDLFKLFLDETMSYSSALYDTSVDRPRRPPARPRRPRATTASRWPRRQVRKIERLLDQTGVGEGTRVLEIGTGWGELAIRAARRGATVHSVTLSSEQLELAEQRIAEAGYADQVTLELSDYRDVQGSYDAVVSVEMIEAVGPRVLVDVLPDHRPPARPRRPGRDPGDHDAARPDARDPEHVDVDQQVHLPRRLPALGHGDRRGHAGGHHAAALRAAVLRPALRARPSSAGTRPSSPPATQVRELGFDKTFRRMWHFYLEYSRAGFASGYIDVQQLTFDSGRPLMTTTDSRPTAAPITAYRGRPATRDRPAPLRRRRAARCGCAPGTARRPVRSTRRWWSCARRDAVRRLLWHPGELGAAQAYVTGEHRGRTTTSTPR